MGDVFHLSDIIGESGEPSVRSAALRIHSALAANEAEIEAVLVGKERLEGELGRAEDAKQDLAGKIAAEVASVIAAMKSGAKWALGQTGNRGTLKAFEKLSVSSIQEAIGEATLKESAEELQRLEAKRERLIVAQTSVIREVMREALQDPLLLEYGILLEQLQTILPRLRGLERFLSPTTHDYRPDAGRIALTVPNFARGDGSEQTIVAEAREVSKIEAVLASYFSSLERDPMAKCQALPELDQSADPSVSYDMLTAPERRAVDAAFAPVTKHRRTVDSELFEEQVAAKSFAALTN
jgi:hypothetical protein